MSIDLSKFYSARRSGTISDGEYLVLVSKAEIAEIAKGTGWVLVVTFLATLKNGFKKYIKDFFYLGHEVSDVVEIAKSRFTDFVGACGLKNPPEDCRAFIGMLLYVKVGTDDKTGDNRILGYRYWKHVDNSKILEKNLSLLRSEITSEEDTIIVPEHREITPTSYAGCLSEKPLESDEDELF